MFIFINHKRVLSENTSFLRKIIMVINSTRFFGVIWFQKSITLVRKLLYTRTTSLCISWIQSANSWWLSFGTARLLDQLSNLLRLFEASFSCTCRTTAVHIIRVRDVKSLPHVHIIKLVYVTHVNSKYESTKRLCVDKKRHANQF